VNKSHSEIIQNLKEIVESSDVITDPEILKQQSLDWVGYRNFERYKGAFRAIIPIAIVLPQNESDVVKVLTYLNSHKINCVPKTGKSGSTGGAEAGDPTTVVLDGSKLNKILSVDTENMQVTVQCGVPLSLLEQELNKRNLTTGHYPQSLPMAQMGGLVATRSTGQFSTLYGGIEDLVIGLKAILPDGTEIKINNVPRRSSGPDLRSIFVGSEGGLAYITEVTLKLFRYAPQDWWINSFAVKDMQTGLKIIRKIMVEGYKPAVVRLHDLVEARNSYSSYIQDNECVLLLVVDGPKSITQATGKAIMDIAAEYGVRTLGEAPIRQWLEHRNDLCDHMLDNDYLRNDIVFETCEISANWSEIGLIYDRVINRLNNEIDGAVNVSGHSSHSYVQGTNIYFMYGFTAEQDLAKNEEKYFSALQIVMDETLKMGGSIAHHHGIGKYRVRWVKNEHGSAYSVMDILKKTFDPNGIMNKGTLFA
jgi:alkyldihydroxyacetonephosphate synthase